MDSNGMKSVKLVSLFYWDIHSSCKPASLMVFDAFFSEDKDYRAHHWLHREKKNTETFKINSRVLLEILAIKIGKRNWKSISKRTFFKNLFLLQPEEHKIRAFHFDKLALSVQHFNQTDSSTWRFLSYRHIHNFRLIYINRLNSLISQNLLRVPLYHMSRRNPNRAIESIHCFHRLQHEKKFPRGTWVSIHQVATLHMIYVLHKSQLGIGRKSNVLFPQVEGAKRKEL
jgi:hypothetical protein